MLGKIELKLNYNENSTLGGDTRHCKTPQNKEKSRGFFFFFHPFILEVSYLDYEKLSLGF